MIGWVLAGVGVWVVGSVAVAVWLGRAIAAANRPLPVPIWAMPDFADGLFDEECR